jgi:Protein of unknown function (DUF4007)
MRKSRLDTSFHESFSLSRPSLSKILAVCHESSESVTPEVIRSRTSLGTNYVKAMPRYARGCGLLSFGSYELTPLGEVVFRGDPGLDDATTQWVMHYHMSAPQGPGPALWYHLVTERLRFFDVLRATNLGPDIVAFVEAQSGKKLGERTARTAATVFLGTYAKSDGLGRLGILDGGSGAVYRVTEPEPPPLKAFAYLLADYWEAVYQNRVTVDLSELAEPQGLSSILLLGPVALDRHLRELQRFGLVEVQRAVPPYQVVRLWRDARALMESLYE